MSDLLANSGFTGCTSKAGLAIGSTATEVSTADPAGTGIAFAINGIAYYKVDDATATLTVHAAQAADTTCAYLIQVDASGVISSVKGDEVLNTLVGTASASGQQAVQIPMPDADRCPIGAIIVTTTGVTFTTGTTDLDAAGVETDYLDFIGGLPARPEILQSVA